MSLSPGTRFGRYEIAELLGKGGMGEVYRAQDTLLHRRVALKVLRPSADGSFDSKSGDAAARILREARAAAGLEHPNAVSIYDVGEVEGVPFLAMEFIAGRTLRAFVGDKSVALARRIRWLTDIARALGAAHQRGLVHRDVKPENVMVREDGFVKVLDFGIARRAKKGVDPNAATEGPALETFTQGGLVVGTPLYMAPEQMRGEPLDGRADQFSWAVVAYELLTGAPPWSVDSSGLQLVAQILSREVDPPRDKNPEIPATVDAAIRIALSKAVRDRFERMERIAEEIEPFAAVSSVASGKVSGRTSIPVGSEEALAPTLQTDPEAMRQGSVNVPSTKTQLATPKETTAKSEGSGGGASRTWIRVAAGVVLASAAIAAVAWRGKGSAGTGASQPPVEAGVVAEPESQMSANAEATAAYRAGMQAWRDASLRTAEQQLSRAIELDGTFAAAHLRRALLILAEETNITVEIREDLQAARNARQTLSPHDRTVLDAIEPWTFVPPDLRESERRFEVARAAHPGDPDIAVRLAWTIHQTYDSPRADTAIDRALSIDATNAETWRLKARERVSLDDVPGAIKAYERCLAESPGGTSCLEDLAQLQADEGRCEDMVGTTRRLVAVAPQVPGSYGWLAQALFGAGAPDEGVRAALKQEWDRLPEAVRIKVQLDDDASLAIVTGRFDEAERLLKVLDDKNAAVPDDFAHYMVAQKRVLVAIETGRSADAVKIADRYLQQRSAWASDELSVDPTITIQAAKLAAGGMTAQDFGKFRAGWLEREDQRTKRVGVAAPASDGGHWVYAYALPASTPEVAALALSAKPSVHPLLVAFDLVPDLAEPIGRVNLLAGRVDDAIPLLRRAAGFCIQLRHTWPIFVSVAAFELGQAFEAQGKTGEACEAYGRVIARWGAARPRSQTALKARARRAALACAP